MRRNPFHARIKIAEAERFALQLAMLMFVDQLLPMLVLVDQFCEPSIICESQWSSTW